MRSTCLFLTAVLTGALGPGVVRAAEPVRKPAVLFLTLHMSRAGGGAYLRQNMQRLHRAGYRVAYHSFPDFYRQKPRRVRDFDVVVLLDQPGIDYKGTGRLHPETGAMFAEIRKLLGEGGGLLLFTMPHEFYMKSLWTLSEPYGLRLLVGCLTDDNPVLATYGCLSYAYTTEVATHALTRGVRGFWYPVGGKTGGNTTFDSLRNANTVPFDVDDPWTVLASARASTRFLPFGKKQKADTAWLQQPQFKKMTRPSPPIVAVRDQVEGKGRIAVCAINMALTNFCGGNNAYDGVCTGKGLEGKPSDLDRLLMNVVDWLGERSVAAGRKTIAVSVTDSFALPPFRFPELQKVKPGSRPLRAPADQFQGVVGVRSTYSGGRSTVAEYAKAARELGLDYLAFLEDFTRLKAEQFDAFKKECEAASDDKLILIPGIRVQNELGIWFFGFRVGLTLPQTSHLKPGTRQLTQHDAGQYQWSVKNGARDGMACGNFRLDVKQPSGVPPSDYNVHNPFVALWTYRDGKLVDTMLDTYLKCAARTEWVSPIVVNLIDSAEALRREWRSDRFRTVYLRDPGRGLAGFRDKIGDRYAFAPVSYVTNGPKIDEWRSTGHDHAGGWWDWTRFRWFVRMKVTSDVGLREIRVLNGTRPFRRFLPRTADGTPTKQFEHTLVLTHSDMNNLILVVTDVKGRQAVSDEQWGKSQLLQLTWCSDRNNMLSYAGLPAPKAASGSTAGNGPTPWNLEKGGFRESLVPPINQDRSRLPHFDGQPMHVAIASPAPLVLMDKGSEGGGRIARDFGRELCSPDAAIHTVSCRLVYDPSVKRPHPWTRGPLVPMEHFHADLRYITFSHAGHLPTPVILEGRIKLLKDVTFSKKRPIGIRVVTMTAWRRWSGYDTCAIQHSRTGNLVTRISYADEPTASASGAFSHGAYIYWYPSMFGSVGLVSLDDGLSYRYGNKCAFVGFDTTGKTLKAGAELTYRLIVLVSGFDEIPSTRLPEAFRTQLGLAQKGRVGYQVKAEHGTVTDTEYVLRIDGKGVGFAGEVVLPRRFPVSLPVVVENLCDRWTSVLYDRRTRRMRPLGMTRDAAYCHRAPTERSGRIFIGHPFTLDRRELCLSVVQTGVRELTVQVHNMTDKACTTTVRRSPYFDMVAVRDFKVTVPPGATAEYVVTPKHATPRVRRGNDKPGGT